jgi:LPXTG-site transpeptidase (sortase) family protein
MCAMEYEDWFWGLEGASLDAEGLEPDSEGWEVGRHVAEEAPAEPAPVSKKGNRTWGTVDGGAPPPTPRKPAPTGAGAAGAMSLTALRRTRVGLVLAIVLLAALAITLLQVTAPKTRSGSSTASSVVDSGADLALEQAAALKVAPVQVDPGPRPPGRLIIPIIGVDAQVLAVGVDKDGNMAVTNESYDVGWYNRGPAPGDAGDAVIDGHLDWYDTSQAVFFNLKNLKVGDDIQVQRLDGSTHHFKVTKVQSVAYNAKVPGLFTPGGPARLSLITCGGQWSKSLNQYVSRVIVDATLSA